MIAVPLVLAHGARGAALALVVTDVVTAAVLVIRSGVIQLGPSAGRVARAGLFGVAAGLLASFAPLVLGVPIVALGTAATALVAVQTNRSLVREGEVSWA